MHWIFTRLTFNRCDDFKNVEKLWDELIRVTTRQYISSCECFNAWKEQTFEFHCSISTQRNYLIVKKANSNHLMMLFGSNKYNLLPEIARFSNKAAMTTRLLFVLSLFCDTIIYTRAQGKSERQVSHVHAKEVQKPESFWFS